MLDLVALEEKLKKLAAQTPFKQFKIFHEKLWLWNELSRVNAELTNLCGIRHPGSFKNANVCFLLQLRQPKISRLDAAI